MNEYFWETLVDFVLEYVMVKFVVTQHNSIIRLLQKIIKDSMAEENIPKMLKRKIVTIAQALQRTAAIQKELTTTFLTNSSFQKHNRMRVLQSGSY